MTQPQPLPQSMLLAGAETRLAAVAALCDLPILDPRTVLEALGTPVPCTCSTPHSETGDCLRHSNKARIRELLVVARESASWGTGEHTDLYANDPKGTIHDPLIVNIVAAILEWLGDENRERYR